MHHAGLLHHVELYVSDLSASVVFWDWFLSLLGYAEHQRWDRGRSWMLGPTYLVLVQVDPEHADVAYHRRRVGLNHLAFHAASRRQVDDVAASLRQRRATILYDSPISSGGRYVLYFEDPDRIKVELVHDERR